MARDRKPSIVLALHLVPRSIAVPSLLLGLAARSALDPSGDGAVDVVAGDPGLVVVLVGARGRASRLVAGKGLGDLDLLGLLGRLDNAGLREQGLDPGLVDKAESGAKQAGEEQVEEDTTATRLALVTAKTPAKLTSGGRGCLWEPRRRWPGRCGPRAGRSDPCHWRRRPRCRE